MKGKGKNYRRMHRDIDRFLEEFLFYSMSKLSSIVRYNTRTTIRKQNVLEHSGAVALIGMVFSDYFNQKGIRNDTEKVIRMALIHDADEVVTGDIPHDAKYSQGQLSEEFRASLGKLADSSLEFMLTMLENEKMHDSYWELLKEERNKSTLEAQIVKMADTADAIIYSRGEENIGNKALSDIHKKELVKIHKMADAIFEKYLKG